MLRKIAVFLIIIVMAVSMTSCAKKTTRYEAEFIGYFDTLTKIVTYTESKEEFTNHSQLIYDNLKIYHELFDIYNDYLNINNIKTINDNAGIKPVKVDKRIIELLLFSKEWYGKTNGNLNVAMGSVLKIWHEYRTEGLDDEANAALPPMEQLTEAAKHTDINKVIIDEANSTVFLEDPLMSLDVGAVAKGFAIEKVTLEAIESGFDSGLISVGGNIRAIGNKGLDSQLWNLGIQNPDLESSQSNLHIVYLTDMSVVSSGDYERYYTVNGRNYNHIIDPVTLFPAELFHSVTIICRDSGVADALSTSLFLMPLDKGAELINSLENTEALWVLGSGELQYSEGFEQYIKK